jgi:hypothetical protein
MPLAKPAFEREPTMTAQEAAPLIEKAPPRLPNAIANGDRATTSLRSVSSIAPTPLPGSSFQPRSPVITGEAHYKGRMPVDGITQCAP